MRGPSVSVIIPTYNKAAYLELSLASWCRQKYRHYELVVIDDGSSDSTQDVLRRYASRLPLRCVTSDHRGRAAARNRGLAASNGAVIVFVDDDRVVPENFLACHVDALVSTPDDQVVIGWQRGLLVDIPSVGDQEASPEVIVRLLRQRPELEAPLAEGRPVKTLTPADLERDDVAISSLQLSDPWESYLGAVLEVYGEEITACPLAWSCGTTGNLSTRRELLDRVGWFDERFTGWGLEDTELHYRMVQGGARTRVVRTALNYHQNHPKDITRRKESWLRNARTFFEKHASMDVALYIQATTTSLSLLDACRIVTEAASLRESALLRAYRRLLMSSAQEIVTYGDM
jgi:glycosyltransferase involved in cell wall biosynthesis